MLAARNRVRTPADFSHTVRSGVRSGRRNVVLYAVCTAEAAPSRFGFIVSKAVGNAVVRNLVKRRLREIAAQALASHPTGLVVVVRALPPAASATWPQLRGDVDGALMRALAQAKSGRERGGNK